MTYLIYILFTVLAILSNAKNYKDVARFIAGHFETLKEVYGIKWRKAPCYTSIHNILIGVVHQRFEETFRKYSWLLSEAPTGKHLCFDGKTLRGSFQNLKNQSDPTF